MSLITQFTVWTTQRKSGKPKIYTCNDDQLTFQYSLLLAMGILLLNHHSGEGMKMVTSLDMEQMEKGYHMFVKIPVVQESLWSKVKEDHQTRGIGNQGTLQILSFHFDSHEGSLDSRCNLHSARHMKKHLIGSGLVISRDWFIIIQQTGRIL